MKINFGPPGIPIYFTPDDSLDDVFEDAVVTHKQYPQEDGTVLVETTFHLRDHYFDRSCGDED